MQLNNFFVEYQYRGQFEIAEIRPCCQENNVYYYDVYISNKYEFTVTPTADENETLAWKMALKNADNHVDAELVDLIGEQIEKHFFNSTI
jgi:hypothetical protein